MSIAPNSQALYYDLGEMPIWSFLHWDSKYGCEDINQKALTDYFDTLFANMKQNGMNQMNFSFAQIDDLNALASGDYSKIDPSDVFGQMMLTIQQNDPRGEDIFSMIVQEAHKEGIKIGLSFGGASAQDAQWKICQNGETPEGQAQKLADFANKYGIDCLDFDIEDDTYLSSQGPGAVQSFFSSLRADLNPSAGMTLTLLGGFSHESVSDTLTYLIKNGGINDFTGVNLMLYTGGAGGKYYIDANDSSDPNNIDWGIEEWLQAIGPENAQKLHIGFDDATQYQDPNAYGDPGAKSPYNIPAGDTAGQAAEAIYEQVLSKLHSDGYSHLGDPFWWPDEDVQPGRYSNPSEFVSQEMKDFYTSFG